jgi:hypothetical protein
MGFTGRVIFFEGDSARVGKVDGKPLSAKTAHAIVESRDASDSEDYRNKSCIPIQHIESIS